jgi:hypothetical protein
MHLRSSQWLSEERQQRVGLAGSALTLGRSLQAIVPTAPNRQEAEGTQRARPVGRPLALRAPCVCSANCQQALYGKMFAAGRPRGYRPRRPPVRVRVSARRPSLAL